MKRMLSLAILAAFALCMPVVAAQTKPSEKVDHVKGTITAWDDASKSFTVKGSDDKELSLSRNDATKVHGTAKVGEEVKVEYSMDKDGKAWATRIWAGKDAIAKSDAKAGAKKD